MRHEDDGFHVFPEAASVAWGVSQVGVSFKRDPFTWRKSPTNVCIPQVFGDFDRARGMGERGRCIVVYTYLHTCFCRHIVVYMYLHI